MVRYNINGVIVVVISCLLGPKTVHETAGLLHQSPEMVKLLQLVQK
jgi:hypothetical protein